MRLSNTLAIEDPQYYKRIPIDSPICPDCGCKTLDYNNQEYYTCANCGKPYPYASC